MNINIVDIGTSKGIRIPKAILKQFNFKHSVSIEILPEGLLIKANTEPRSGWAELFAASTSVADDDFADWQHAPLTTFEEEVW